MADNKYTEAEDNQWVGDIDRIFADQKHAFSKAPFPDYAKRIEQLKALRKAIVNRQDELLTALSEDFGCRAFGDTKMGDLVPTLANIDYMVKHLKKWMKPSKRKVGVMFQPAKAYVMYQPLGVVGIITPWNYPIMLSIGPLATAIASGNRAMIKMSEFTPHTNQVIEKLVADVFDTSQAVVIHGGPKVAAHFSTKAFDHLLFTGSTRVGKLVMAEAAKNLTPVTLELGGKSPTIIDPSMSIDDAVARFIFGKTLNAGQTCVAPDYILCPEDKVEALIAQVRQWFNKMYPNVQDNADYTAVINNAQFQRLNAWLDDAQAKGATVSPMVGNGTDSAAKEAVAACAKQGKIPLTLVTGVNDEMTLMQEEIFGPILPIVSYKQLDEAVAYINQRPRPLALYLLSHDKDIQKHVLTHTHAGGVCINDTTVHVAQDDLPFGGVGPSGMGHYHGHEGFLTFSKAKGVYHKGRINMAPNAFPPYNNWMHKLIDKLFI